MVPTHSLTLTGYHYNNETTDSNRTTDSVVTYTGADVPMDLVTSSTHVDIRFQTTTDNASLAVDKGFSLAHAKIGKWGLRSERSRVFLEKWGSGFQMWSTF